MNDDLPRTRFLGHVRSAMSPARFWMTVALGLVLGVLIGLPFALLILFHEGPWTGFLWDLLWRLPFALLCVLLIFQFIKAIRAKQLKGAGAGIVVLVLFCSFTGFAWYGFVWHVSAVIHFHRLALEQVRSVRVACRVTDDSHSIEQIVRDLREAQWYSPDSHGWAPYAPVTLEFADGHREEYALTKTLVGDRLVIRVPRGDRNLLTIPHLRNSMEAAGLLQVASYPRFDKRGLYQALVPSSACRVNSPTADKIAVCRGVLPPSQGRRRMRPPESK